MLVNLYDGFADVRIFEIYLKQVFIIYIQYVFFCVQYYTFIYHFENISICIFLLHYFYYAYLIYLSRERYCISVQVS